MARRVNDKAIKNVNIGVASTVVTRVVSSATNNAFTHERFIFTGALLGATALDDTSIPVGICVVHLRGDSLPITNMILTDDSQMWPDDAAVLFQGLWQVSGSVNRTSLPLHIDVKGKRKLRIGDSIQMLFLGSTDGIVKLTGCLTAFGKLA